MSGTVTRAVTADELLALPGDGFRYELIKGELKQMSPAGHEHGAIVMALAAPLYSHVRSHKLGRVFAAETGFKIGRDPDTVRAPDIAFVRQERVEKEGKSKGYWSGAPDLAVEVISPSDKVSEVDEKIQQWLEAGTRLVWVVNPKLRTVTVYRSNVDAEILTVKDTLDGGEVVLGFQIPIAELFNL